MGASPFRVGGPVTGEFFTDRADEVSEILRAMKEPTRMLIRGPRRQGKTSAIAQAGRRFREEGGILIWVDVSTIATLTDLRGRLLSSLPTGFFGLFEGLQKLVPILEVVLADPSTGAQSYRFRPGIARRREPGVREQIRILLESIDRRRSAIKRPVAVVLDEIQAVLSLNEEGADWYLRDLMQSAPEVSFLCAGSQPTILEAMVNEKEAAFFRFFTTGPRFDPIDKDHMGNWIAHRMTEAGVTCDRTQAEAIAAIGDRTQDIIQFADEVFSRGQGSGRVDDGVLKEALRSILRKEHERYLRIWEGLTSNQRVGLRAVAAGIRNLFAHDSGLPIPPSSLHRVLEALHSRRILTDGAPREEVDDPFFREWILRYAMPDSVPLELS
jgi:hypothetical protein